MINSNIEEVKVVSVFVYLGSKITSDCSSGPDIYGRHQLACSAIGSFCHVWHSTRICPASMLLVLNSMNWSHHLNTYNRICLCYTLGICWSDFLTIEELEHRAGGVTQLSTTIKRSRLRLLGHIACMDNIPIFFFQFWVLFYTALFYIWWQKFKLKDQIWKKRVSELCHKYLHTSIQRQHLSRPKARASYSKDGSCSVMLWSLTLPNRCEGVPFGQEAAGEPQQSGVLEVQPFHRDQSLAPGTNDLMWAAG